MHSVQLVLTVCAAVISSVSATNVYRARSLKSVLSERQSSGPSQNLVIDLGYERYQGVSNATTGLNDWFGYVVAVPMHSSTSDL